MLIICAIREIHIVAGIDSRCGFLSRTVEAWQLVYRCIITYHHPVEADVISQDVLQNPTISHAILLVGGCRSSLHRMIPRHDRLAACQPNHRLMGHQNLLHQLLLVSIATTSVSEIMLRASTHTFLQIALLQTLHEGRTHHRRQVSILAIRFLQPVETRHAAHIHHRRER